MLILLHVRQVLNCNYTYKMHFQNFNLYVTRWKLSITDKYNIVSYIRNRETYLKTTVAEFSVQNVCQPQRNS